MHKINNWLRSTQALQLTKLTSVESSLQSAFMRSFSMKLCAWHSPNANTKSIELEFVRSLTMFVASASVWGFEALLSHCRVSLAGSVVRSRPCVGSHGTWSRSATLQLQFSYSQTSWIMNLLSTSPPARHSSLSLSRSLQCTHPVQLGNPLNQVSVPSFKIILKTAINAEAKMCRNPLCYLSLFNHHIARSKLEARMQICHMATL